MPLIPHPRRRRKQAERGMTVIEHLTELRTRLFITVIAIAIGSILGWFLYPQVFELLTDPFVEACRTLPANSQPPQGCEDALVVFRVTEPFLVRFKVSTFTGLALALPVVLYELWAFITPGLTKRERRLSIPFVIASMVLFALGALFAFLTLPKALEFLLGFAAGTLVPVLSVGAYIGFIVFLILAFGLAFEFPLVLIFLALARVVTSKQLRKWRRYAYVGITVAAAVITPSQDPYTMLAMAVPMAVFYELAILVARLFKR
jgi:sec-independent protein translocase protein TatC